jgi:hypothetical protein
MAGRDLRKLTCPSCGHTTAYDPRDCPRYLRFVGLMHRTHKRKAEVVFRVRCAGCGKEQDVEPKGR